MHKKLVKTALLSIVFMLFLSGCFSYRFSFEHNQVGEGKIRIETILKKEFLDMVDELGSLGDEDGDNDMDVPVFTKDELEDDPNIKSITEDVFIDPDTGAQHHVLDIEVYNIFDTLRLDEDDEDANGMIYNIEDQGDGTFRFSAFIKPQEIPLDDDEEGFGPDTFAFFMQDSYFIWELKVEDFIKGDPKASYDPASNMVTWKVPMTEILYGVEPTEIYAIYRVKSSGIIQPKPEEEPIEDQPIVKVPETENTVEPLEDIEPEKTGKGLFGLPNWVLYVLLSTLCLGVIVIVIVVVVILVIRKKKKNQPQE